MPAPGFAALFEVSTETFGLCVACIGGVGFGCRSAMNRNSGLMHLSGLGASLLTAFYCLYGECGAVPCYLPYPRSLEGDAVS